MYSLYIYIQFLTAAPPTTDPAGQPASSDPVKLETAPESPLKSVPQLDASPVVPQQVLPASTELLADRRFYILSDQPQFFGKYNAIHTPLNSVFQLQPLQAIQARSAEPLAQPEAIASPILYNSPQTFAAPLVNDQLETTVPATAQLLQARSELSIEQEPQSDPELKAEPLPNQDDDTRETNRALLTPEDDETPQENSRFVGEARGNSEAEVEEQSVAQAKPTAIALAGKGGVASSKPIATAVVGDNGLALAAPTATALSGDFKEEEDADKKLD